MRRVLVLTATMFLGTVTWAGETDKKAENAPDGAALLKMAASAVKSVKSVSYSADYKATGWLTKFVPNAVGKAALGERSKWDLEKFRSEVKITPAGSNETIELTAGCDGDVFFLIDPATKKAHQDMDPAVLGKQSRNVQRVLMKVLVDPQAFKDELKSEKIEWKGVESVNGEDCNVVAATLEGGQQNVWYLAKKDSLPRRLLRILPDRENPSGENGTTDLVLSGFSSNPKFSTDPFQLIVPEGFTRTDEFAP